MTPEVEEFARDVLKPYVVAGARVIDLGGHDVNGSLRAVIEPLSAGYVVVDELGAPDVDLSCRIEELSPGMLALADFSDLYDLVLCTETLEHVGDWRAAVGTIKRLMDVGAHALVTTCGGNFPQHDYPGDFWRFTLDQLVQAFADCLLVESREVEYETGGTGVFVLVQRPDVDLYAIMPDEVA